MRTSAILMVVFGVATLVDCRENVPDEPARTPPNSPIPTMDRPTEPKPTLLDGGAASVTPADPK